MDESPRPRSFCRRVPGFRPTEFAAVHRGADGLMQPLNIPLCPLGGRRNSADWTWPLPLPFSPWQSFDTKKTASQALAGCRKCHYPWLVTAACVLAGQDCTHLSPHPLCFEATPPGGR